MLLGNKRDLEHLREVESHEGESLASQYKVAFSEVTLSLSFSENCKSTSLQTFQNEKSVFPDQNTFSLSENSKK